MENQIKELENTHRIIANIQNLISDCEIKGNMSLVVSEALQFLVAFQKNVEGALENLKLEERMQARSKHEPVKVVDSQEVLRPSQG